MARGLRGLRKCCCRKPARAFSRRGIGTAPLSPHWKLTAYEAAWWDALQAQLPAGALPEWGPLTRNGEIVKRGDGEDAEWIYWFGLSIAQYNDEFRFYTFNLNTYELSHEFSISHGEERDITNFHITEDELRIYGVDPKVRFSSANQGEGLFGVNTDGSGYIAYDRPYSGTGYSSLRPYDHFTGFNIGDSNPNLNVSSIPEIDDQTMLFGNVTFIQDLGILGSITRHRAAFFTPGNVAEVGKIAAVEANDVGQVPGQPLGCFDKIDAERVVVGISGYNLCHTDTVIGAYRVPTWQLASDASGFRRLLVACNPYTGAILQHVYLPEDWTHRHVIAMARNRFDGLIYAWCLWKTHDGEGFDGINGYELYTWNGTDEEVKLIARTHGEGTEAEFVPYPGQDDGVTRPFQLEYWNGMLVFPTAHIPENL